MFSAPTRRQRTATRKSLDDTIAAVSTPPGEGGIGIVRISGRSAVSIAETLFRPASGGTGSAGCRRVQYGHVIGGGGGIVDEVLLHVMRAPHSFTREDVVEINCHGGAGPLNAVLDLVLANGARLAEPGEFTQRAFLNGRIDLVQAEAVIDTIRARTQAGLRAAAAAASGALSRDIGLIKVALVDALARVEAAVDFPDEDLPDLVGPALRRSIEGALDRMQSLLDTAEAGRLYREGAGMAIAGRPNVGKSSLFNALLRDSRAIVSPLPGTTRDRIEELITLAGVPVRITDTAGLHDTHDAVERIGVKIARDAVQNADFVLLVVDAAAAGPEDEALAAELGPEELGPVSRPVWVAWNKIDLAPAAAPPEWVGRLSGCTPVSATTGAGLDDLEKALGTLLLGPAPIAPEHGLISRAHQRDSLRRAAASITRLLENFDASPEFLAADLREALDALAEITGETTPEDILATIFSSFCIGK
jgi:tRNA modification GTPase